jgi:hypothetical protein
MEDAALRVQHNGAGLREAALITDLDAPLKRDMMIFVGQQLSVYKQEIAISLTSELKYLLGNAQPSIHY